MTKNFNKLSAVAFIINCMLGSGINYMPAAFNRSGNLFSFVMLFIVASFTTFSIYALLRCCSKYPNEQNDISYANIGKLKYRKLKLIIDIALLISSIFAAIGFQKYISELLKTFTLQFFPGKSVDFARYLYILILMTSTLVLTGLSMINNLAKFKILSRLCVFCIVSLLAVLLILKISISNLDKYSSSSDRNFSGYAFSLSFFIFAMSVQANIPTLYTNLKYKTKVSLLKIASLASFVGFVVYGLAGYLGNKFTAGTIGTNDIITFFLDNNSSLNLYLRNNNDLGFFWSKFLEILTQYQSLCSVLLLIVGFPLQLAPAARFLKEYVLFNDTNPSSIHNITIIALMSFVTVINLIPNLSLNLIFSLYGPMVEGFLCFLFPLLLYICYSENKLLYKKILAGIVIFLSIVYSIFGVTGAIVNEINHLHAVVEESNHTIEQTTIAN